MQYLGQLEDDKFAIVFHKHIHLQIVGYAFILERNYTNVPGISYLLIYLDLNSYHIHKILTNHVQSGNIQGSGQSLEEKYT